MASWTVPSLSTVFAGSNQGVEGVRGCGRVACPSQRQGGWVWSVPWTSLTRAGPSSGFLPTQAWRRRRYRGALKQCVAMAEKMYIPNDSFGGRSPEKLAAEKMETFFTFAACRIILAQLEGSGRGGLGSYNAAAYQDLMDFLQKNPLKNSDEWLAKLMAHNELLGVRVMEVRAAYCDLDFEWEEMRRLANKGIQESNVRLMRQHAVQKFGKLASGGPDVPQEGVQ